MFNCNKISLLIKMTCINLIRSTYIKNNIMLFYTELSNIHPNCYLPNIKVEILHVKQNLKHLQYLDFFSRAFEK